VAVLEDQEEVVEAAAAVENTKNDSLDAIKRVCYHLEKNF